MEEGDAAGAQTTFREALRLAPGLAEAHANLGLVLDRCRKLVEAEVHYRKALELAAHQTKIHMNFGAMLAGQKRFAEAETVYRQALGIDPDSPGTLSNLGVLLACTGRENEAEQCYRRAMALAPAYRKPPFNLAYLLLRQGRYEEGWGRLQARDWHDPLEKELQFPRWQGEPLTGKSILIGFEAGHGDMIQFCRYATLVRKAGAMRVSLLCHPGLKSLFERLDGVDEVIALGEPVARDGWDFWTVPMTLPFLFHTTLDTIPAKLPYLFAQPERVRHWAGIMQDCGAALRVGLAWKGNPNFENNPDRSLPSLGSVASLGHVPGVRFFSLQKGPGQEEALHPPLPLSLTDLAPRIKDFGDTAAAIMNLDLVISIDTAVAHLAGALGKPCWVLLPDFKPDWRWLAGRADSPWYPDVMRLFRQQQPGDWMPVIAEVGAALRKLVSTWRAA